MLISSKSIRGKCPICGAANCACGGPTKIVAVDERMEVTKVGGKLITVEITKGVGMKMYEEVARARGLLPPVRQKKEASVVEVQAPEVKARKPDALENKMREPTQNKAGGGGRKRGRPRKVKDEVPEV